MRLPRSADLKSAGANELDLIALDESLGDSVESGSTFCVGKQEAFPGDHKRLRPARDKDIKNTAPFRGFRVSDGQSGFESIAIHAAPFVIT